MIFQNCYTKFHESLGEWNLRQIWNITSGIYAKYYMQIMLLFVYTTTRKRFVIFTCRYFKLSWNATALNQSNCRNFPCSSIKMSKMEPLWQICCKALQQEMLGFLWFFRLIFLRKPIWVETFETRKTGFARTLKVLENCSGCWKVHEF